MRIKSGAASITTLGARQRLRHPRSTTCGSLCLSIPASTTVPPASRIGRKVGHMERRNGAAATKASVVRKQSVMTLIAWPVQATLRSAGPIARSCGVVFMKIADVQSRCQTSLTVKAATRIGRRAGRCQRRNGVAITIIVAATGKRWRATIVARISKTGTVYGLVPRRPSAARPMHWAAPPMTQPWRSRCGRKCTWWTCRQPRRR
mmetsp:Transcript_82279/g.167668  ORF Transcript_82279/g.167668 Transcript_82279/m.167668 type:complete len:205 (+) Transcript_82279:589-1203(+)